MSTCHFPLFCVCIRDIMCPSECACILANFSWYMCHFPLFCVLKRHIVLPPLYAWIHLSAHGCTCHFLLFCMRKRHNVLPPLCACILGCTWVHVSLSSLLRVQLLHRAPSDVRMHPCYFFLVHMTNYSFLHAHAILCSLRCALAFLLFSLGAKVLFSAYGPVWLLPSAYVHATSHTFSRVHSSVHSRVHSSQSILLHARWRR